MRSGAWVLGCLVALSACGGNVKNRERPAPATGGNGGSAGTPSSSEAGEAAMAGAAPIDLVGCPNSKWLDECHTFWQADLDFSGATQREPAGIWVEPLQLPEFEEQPIPPTPDMYTHNPPETWDRSPMPAGACVFRLHGVRASCLSTAMTLQGRQCNDETDGPTVIPLSYYELDECNMGVAPGCPSADPWSWDGNYWYAVPSDTVADEVTIVACAPLCRGWLGARACLVGGSE